VDTKNCLFLSTGDYVVDPGGLLRQDFHLRAVPIGRQTCGVVKSDTMILGWLHCRGCCSFQVYLAELAMSIPYFIPEDPMFSIVSGPD